MERKVDRQNLRKKKKKLLNMVSKRGFKKWCLSPEKGISKKNRVLKNSKRMLQVSHLVRIEKSMSSKKSFEKEGTIKNRRNR